MRVFWHWIAHLHRTWWLMMGMAWAVIVIVFSLMPRGVMPHLFITVKDLVLHFVAYMTMAFFWTMGSRSKRGPYKPALLSLAVGLALEYGQAAMNLGRTFSIHDLIANALGMLFGLSIAIALRQFLKRFKNEHHGKETTLKT